MDSGQFGDEILMCSKPSWRAVSDTYIWCMLESRESYVSITSSSSNLLSTILKVYNYNGALYFKWICFETNVVPLFLCFLSFVWEDLHPLWWAWLSIKKVDTLLGGPSKPKVLFDWPQTWVLGTLIKGLSLGLSMVSVTPIRYCS